jgi:hypothetical protein
LFTCSLADEVLLVYSTIAIHSCANAENAAALDQQMQAIIDADVEQRGPLSVWCQQQQATAGEAGGEGQQTLQFGCAQVSILHGTGCFMDSFRRIVCTAMQNDCLGSALIVRWPSSC